METVPYHILIVDDVLKNLQLTAQILKEEGYHFSLATDGRSALKLLETEIPDLILLDVMMPEMDGYEVCRRIKQIESLKEIPIVFLTARDQTSDLIEGFKSGGVDYVLKPVNRLELLIRIKNHLELSTSKKQLTEVLKTRDKLYSIITHDIRSPLSGIAMITNMLKTEILQPDSPQFQEIIQQLDKSARKTLVMLNNLVEWTKVQAGIISLNPQMVKILPIINDSLQLLEPNFNEKNITAEISVPSDAEAYFDLNSIHAVFRNLFSNAVKFTPGEGKISVSFESNHENVFISVKDNGVGIPENVLAKIYRNKELYTSNGTNKEQGSGLGLFLVRDFIEQNHGKLIIESNPGNGSNFIVQLPKNKLK